MQPRARDMQGDVHWAQVWGEEPGGDAERLPKVIITCPQDRCFCRQKECSSKGEHLLGHRTGIFKQNLCMANLRDYNAWGGSQVLVSNHL